MPDILQDVSTIPTTARLTGKVHRVLGMNPSAFTGPGTNTYLVGMDGGDPALIDTGSGKPEWAALLRDYLEETQAPPIARCLMTHGHVDHVSGVPDVATLAPGASFHKLPWPGKGDANPQGSQTLSDGDVVQGEGYTLRAVYTPGHAPDHLCFYLEEEKALFSGDVILGVGTTVIPRESGDLGDYLASLRRLQGLDLERIYPGHGPVIEDPQAKIAFYIEHRLEREAQILDGLAGGARSIPELVAVIYRNYPSNLHAAAGQSVGSHLDKLEKEGRVTRDEGDPDRYARTA